VTDFELQLSTRSEAAGPGLGDSSDVAAEAVRYLEIENTNIAPSQHDETTVQFRVSKAAISRENSVEDGITLYQYDGSEYKPLPTTRIPGDDTASEFAYQATFDSFNDLVVGAGQPDLGLTGSASANGVPDTLESGQTTTVTVSADVENTGSIAGSDTVRVRDSGSTLNSTTVNVGAGGTPTVPVDVDLTGPGSRTLTVALGGQTGQTQDVTVDIDSPDDGSPPAGGGDDDDAPADEPTDVPAPVEEIGAEPETVESVTPTVDADAGQTVAEFETADTVEEVALDTTEGVDEVTISELDTDTVESDTDTEPVPGDAAAVQDISVPDEAEDTSATIGFEVSPDQVSGDAENLRAFRLVDDDWQALETEVVEATDDSIVLEAETPGFSLFAVSEVQPPEASLSLDSTPAQVGDEVTLSGADSADPDGEIEAYEWTVDGETLTGETVTVTLDEPGEYTVELAVTDDAGETDTVTETLVIEAADTETATPAPETPEPDVQSPTEAPPEEPGGFDTLPAVVVIVVLALGVGYIAYRRREQ
jgi:PGF-pre-PGF domain-containing protein